MSVATRICLVVTTAVVATGVLRGAPVRKLWPDQGHVPTASAAIAITVRLWSPIYGDTHLASEKPYHATLEDGVWTVMGSIPRGALGGAAVLKIKKNDGKVLLLSHYR